MMKKLKNMVKDLLAIKWVRNTYEKLNLFILSIASSNRLFATIYSIPGFITFNREQYAVLSGRRDYYRNLSKKRQSHVELRRNVHRLEKGMIMQPRRAVFARDYIEETLGFYEEAVGQCSVDQASIDISEVEWAYSVLDKYFATVDDSNQVINDCRSRFEQSKEVYQPKDKIQKSPFKRKDGVKSNVSYDDLLDLSTQRRSVRWFKDKPVPREMIDKAMMVGRQAPTACNRLPYEFKVFDEPELVKKISDIPFGAAGYSHQIPSIVVVVGDLRNYFSPRDRHAIYVDSSLAAMSFMFGLETLGLSSSVINWPDFEPLEIKMQKTLGLQTGQRVVMLIAVGYADPEGEIPFSQKKEIDNIRTYNSI